MKKSTRFLAPLVAVAVVALAVQWSIASRADAVSLGSDAFETDATEASFEYFPAQFDMNAAESSEDIPTF